MNNSLSVTEDYFSGGADIFEDGVINAKDGLKLAQYLAGCNVTLSTREQLSADIFKDNVINAKDGLKLSQFLAGWNIILGN
jgi:hypothetical protein